MIEKSVPPIGILPTSKKFKILQTAQLAHLLILHNLDHVHLQKQKHQMPSIFLIKSVLYLNRIFNQLF
jgi:hypothetical protein